MAKSITENTENFYAKTALELTLDNLDTLIYINDIDTGEILFINKKMVKEFGGEPKDFIGRKCWEVLQKDFKEMCDFCPIPKLKKSGGAYCVWEEHNTVTNRYYQNTDSLIKWVDGRTVHMQHSVDITDHKMFEIKISEMVNRLEAIMANYPGILICLDMNKVCTMASGTNLEKMGVSREDLVGNNVYDVLPHFKEEMDKSFARSYSGKSSNWIMKIDGDDYNCFETPLLNKDGKIYGILFAANDISETIKAQNKLQKAVEMAQQANKAKSEFLSRMSHEIRTPMNAIIGMTKVAQETEDAERIKYCLDNIDSSSRHLLELINDVLDLSKIEANKMSIENERFNIEKMLINVNNIVIEKSDNKHQKLNFFIDSNMRKYFIGDEFRISQVLINLISNAVKFTPEEGTINITVKEVKNDTKSTTVGFYVEDTGIGISPELQERIFNSFEQADGSTARKYGGSGLGLSISKSIVEKIGGKIWVESEMGKGSTFKVEIKLNNTGDQEERKWQGNSLDNLRILVVDDSKEICEYFLNIMDKFGIKADAALSGQEAIDKMSTAYKQKQPYSIVFLDWRMPEMDGIETVRQLKDRKVDNTVIIMISASEWSEIEPQAKSVGIDKFIPKPLFPSTILNAISETIGGISREVENKKPLDHDFSNVNALLVEDIKVNQEVFKALMERTKINVDTADDGMEAVMKFRGNPDKYDLIFMDIQMPEMDGYEATRKIRELDEIENAKDIPIIAMTANVFKEDIDKCIAAGMNDHLGKPIDRDSIIEKILFYTDKAKINVNPKNSEPIKKAAKPNQPSDFLPYIDIEEMKKRLGGDENICKTLLKSFIDNKYIENLRFAMKQIDRNKAREIAHTIKGVSSNLSLTELYNLSIGFEEKAKGAEDLAQDFRDLEQAMTTTKEYIKHFIES